jgi:hypothetical protein
MVKVAPLWALINGIPYGHHPKEVTEGECCRVVHSITLFTSAATMFLELVKGIITAPVS